MSKKQDLLNKMNEIELTISDIKKAFTDAEEAGVVMDELTAEGLNALANKKAEELTTAKAMLQYIEAVEFKEEHKEILDKAIELGIKIVMPKEPK